jgi:hypothetical protein
MEQMERTVPIPRKTMRSHDSFPSVKPQPRSQSVPKRVRFADSPCIFEACPQRVFARPLTASDFPTDVLDPPALCTPVRHSRKKRALVWLVGAIVALLFVWLFVSLGRSWLSDCIPASSPLAAALRPKARQSQEVVLGTCLIGGAVALLIYVSCRK